MSFDVGQFLEELKASPVFILLGLFVVLLSSLITISSGVALLVKFYRSTLGYKQVLLGNLSRLAAGVSISYFQAILGPHVFEKTADGRREHVFVNEYFYVQAITNSEGTVIVFSVTTRTRHFNPSLTMGPYSLTGEIIRIRLGRTKFADIDAFAKPSKLFCSLGARRFQYYEERYFGNPGNYQVFLFAINDAGYRGHAFISPRSELSIDDPQVKEFRQDAVINTYTITAPFRSSDDLKGFWVGPDHDQVRIVDGYAGVSRRELRRLRKIFWEMSPYEYFKKYPKPRRDGRW
ncbi:MAG TPA: ETEC_3214 domain-containing protein [Candidatus Acidoferrales bacterium]|nr:ETEC_3214 domain-containing protein [Candidatus Acidoferrales bacterium]